TVAEVERSLPRRSAYLASARFTLGAGDKIPRNALDIGRAGETHHHVQLGLEVAVGAPNAPPPAERRTIERRTAERDGTGAQRQRAEPVLAAEDPAIDDDRHAAFDGSRDPRQSGHRRRRIIQLPTAPS